MGWREVRRFWVEKETWDLGAAEWEERERGLEDLETKVQLATWEPLE